MRECLQDVYDLPALKELFGKIERRQIRIVEVETPSPSPFASALLFNYVGAFMYEGDSPWLSDAPPLCPWTPRCWPNSSAASNCVSYSTPE
ncbi:hypothetical protein GCM10020255_068690 [Rhodococcus baikonurensis]